MHTTVNSPAVTTSVTASVANIGATHTAPAHPRRAPAAPSRHRARGFTLIELMMAVSVVGVLSSVAYPSFQDQVQRVRRTDAVVTLMQVQLAQERWRANSMVYGSLAQIGVPARSMAGHYTVRVANPTVEGYDVIASATGSQGRDTACAHLKLSMQGANPVYTSGPDESTANTTDTNRRCWSL